MYRTGMVPLLKFLAATTTPSEQPLYALLIYNLATIGGAAAADALLAENIDATLRPLLLESGLSCLAATIAAAHLARHADRRRRGRIGRRRLTDEEKEEEQSLLVFSDRYFAFEYCDACALHFQQ
jgi:hypothetical protein